MPVRQAQGSGSASLAMVRRTLAVAAAVFAIAVPAVAADAPIVASLGDAHIAHQSGSDVWTIGSRELDFTIAFDGARNLAPRSLSNPITGRAWSLATDPDVTVTIGGERITLSQNGPLTLANAETQVNDAGVVLSFIFEHRTQRVRITRSYACYPGSPTIETWMRIESTGGNSIDVGDLTGWRFTMPAGAVRWLGGLRHDSADNDDLGAFSLDGRDLDDGERMEIGSDRRSSEEFIPLVFVDGANDAFYGGVMWSGAWRLALERHGDRLAVSTFFPGVSTTVTGQQALDLPHTFFGVAPRSAAAESRAIQQFILNGIRRGRPFRPLVTYNTWYPYGTTIDESTMVAEMDRAAALGAELFVLDAGWWTGAGENGPYDYDSGLGNWSEDGDRFPSSLASLADYAHGLGLQFGLWVEPARVALSAVDKPGLAREAWLATAGRDYGQPSNAQICLARPEARQWVLAQLVALIERVHPDYLKWDNNFWINCDRNGHGHGTSDGSFAHVRDLYRIFAELRRQFPDLMIENVSGGGNRLDFGMLAYTDVAWMDDRTAPATRVRHNLEGLAFAFPPAYLLSFLIDAEGEPLAGGTDLALLARSRMPGVLGVTYRSDSMGDDTFGSLAVEIANYKRLRDIISTGTATLLSEQAPVDDASWDVLQVAGSDGRTLVLFAFKGDADDGRLLVHPRGLRDDLVYDVESLDAGAIGAARGDVIVEDGVEIVHSGTSRAHVLILTARN